MYGLSFDLDWVPDFVVQDTLELLGRYEMPATFFMTNPLGSALPDFIEAGIHPNFFPHSTQGESEEKVLAYCQRELPAFKGVRTHRLYWHGGLEKRLAESGCLYDSSLFLPLQAHIQPFVEQQLIRIPFYWGDNFHLRHGLEMKNIVLADMQNPGIRIFQFHPINLYLNTCDPAYLQSIKEEIHPLPEQSEAHLVSFRQNKKLGIRDYFLLLLEYLKTHQLPVYTLVEIAHHYKETHT